MLFGVKCASALSAPTACASLSSEPLAPAISQGLMAPYSSQVADTSHARLSP